MELKFENPNVLSSIFDNISDIITEVKIKVNDSGMHINAIDPSNVSMVNFFAPKSFFSQFKTKDEVLSVNLVDLKRVLKRAKPKNSVIIKKSENKLIIEIDDKTKRIFELSLINNDIEEKDIPDINFSSKIVMKSDDLIVAMEDCSVVGDSCSFKIDDNKFIIESGDFNKTKTEFSQDDIKIEGTNCQSRFSIEFLNKFMKFAKMCEMTNLNIGNNLPLKLEFKIGDIKVDILLAPRVGD